MGMVFKPIDELRKEGEQGRRKIDQYTRYGTIVLSRVPGVRHRDVRSRASTTQRSAAAFGDVVTDPGWASG